MTALARAVVVGAPIALGVLAAIHPPTSSDAVPRWMVIHVLQVPLVALLGIAVLALLRGLDGRPAGVARLAVLPWVAAFAAFDGVAGLAEGALADFAQSNPDASAVVAEIELVDTWYTEALGFMAILSAIILFAGAATALIRSGSSMVGTGLLAAGGIVWTVIHPLVGAAAMVAFLLGALLVMRSRDEPGLAAPAESVAPSLPR
jgi:hypothetical protein